MLVEYQILLILMLIQIQFGLVVGILVCYSKQLRKMQDEVNRSQRRSSLLVDTSERLQGQANKTPKKNIKRIEWEY